LRQAGIMLACYALGIVAAACTAYIFKRTLTKGPATSFILELPSYKIPQVSQIAPMWVERAVLAVAEITSRHDAEGAYGGERANLRAAQPHVAVSRPDTLAFRAARQLEVAREHIARVEWLALARIGQPTAAALAQLATLVVAVACVITPTRIEVHSYLRLESSSERSQRMAAA